MLRFSDSELGGVTIAWVGGKNNQLNCRISLVVEAFNSLFILIYRQIKVKSLCYNRSLVKTLPSVLWLIASRI